MEDQSIISALVLGLIEGLTEFVPVSSTAHVLLAGHFLGFESPGKTFAVLRQLGAILAILSVYFAKLLGIALSLPTSVESRRFVGAVLVAFLPAAVIGALAHDFIKTVLFETPMLICVVLILGGLVPGTSRSGATIVGALLLGADKRSAAEFSFFLAMPTMLGAFTLDLYKNRNAISADDGLIIAIGFVAAFVSALFVVRGLLNFVSKRGYAPFAWWRIAVGTAGIIGLLTFG